MFASGVPLVMFPLDATLLRLDDLHREALFSRSSPLTDALATLYHPWAAAYQPWASSTPTLFDVVPVTALLDATLCPTLPLHIGISADGHTPESPGTPNALVCLKAVKSRLLERAMQAWLR